MTAVHEIPIPATAPKFKLPRGACDCHIHITEGTGRFPVLRQTHPPVHAPYEVRTAMLEATGLRRIVGVQLMAYGADNRALIEALSMSRDTMRGISELAASASDQEMEALHAAGVRGLRFYIELPTTVPGISKVEGVGFADLAQLAPRMKALGWVAQISARCDTIVAQAPFLSSLGIPIVLEHMGGCEAARAVADPVVQTMVSLLSGGQFWVKLTVCAMSKRPPDYEDLRPIHDAFVRGAPERLVWGSNWPHRPVGDKTPQMSHLLNLFDDWIGHDPRLRHAILSDNPARLFGF
jgi:predicted TIM-barrel fold metal-dependent hydrolase